MTVDIKDVFQNRDTVGKLLSENKDLHVLVGKLQNELSEMRLITYMLAQELNEAVYDKDWSVKARAIMALGHFELHTGIVLPFPAGGSNEG